MLARLQVRNYVLIDSLEIDFPEGLIIITGQTGAGKSILLGALSLVTGAKADASMVSDGADNCVVEAEFDAVDESIRNILEENEAEWDEGHLIIRRVVNRSGRSRAFVNDSPVPVTVLQDIASRLIDIHSQHQTLLLSDKQFQLDILDHYAGNGRLRTECSAAWKGLAALKAELARLESQIARIASERPRLQRSAVPPARSRRSQGRGAGRAGRRAEAAGQCRGDKERSLRCGGTVYGCIVFRRGNVSGRIT